MSKLTAWIKKLFGGGNEEEPALEEELEREDEENPYRSRAERASILGRVRRDAEADAIRHAEDMLNRDFPIVSQAEGIAETRLATLRTAYAERRGEIVQRTGGLETAESEAAAQLRATERALVAEGIEESQINLPPLRQKAPVGERILILLGSAVLLAIPIELLDLEGPLVLPLLGAIVLAVILALALQPGELLEEPAVAALREKREAQAEELAKLRRQLQLNRDALTELERQTYAVVEEEVKFAEELAASYNSTVFSSLPAGVLAEKRQLKEQKRPVVRVPKWALGLTGAE